MQARDAKLPADPQVEVFNLWDVLTSMDKDEWRQRGTVVTNTPIDRVKGSITTSLRNNLITPVKRRFGKPEPAGLQDVVFVPPSNCIDFKQELTRRGNGKARLRPMR
eukprot:CAMPEP_0198123386 /NCGR_PEP_ID=MMETSP1442-20131203/37395_1 /TAXON_ID= /ORGANISM="Craspedostauros australis, Strain CCMP3328" /LENGTH=106 /DNA_ID=CAMNT_0043782587 /DNA_START=1 /DNA_END=321 /DNA_ORIENTATION=+